MKCPNCNSDNIEASNKYSFELSAYGTCVECLNCGLSSPVVAGQNEHAHEVAEKLFANIKIDKPSLQIAYSSSKRGLSVGARLYVIACVVMVGLTLFLLTWAIVE